MNRLAMRIACRRGRAYLQGVNLRLFLSFLVALAVALVPAGMPAAAATPAGHHQAAANTGAGHCAEAPEPAKQQAPDDCCLMTCVALPPTGGTPLAAAIAPAPLLSIALAADFHGLDPEAETPPPRFS